MSLEVKPVVAAAPEPPPAPFLDLKEIDIDRSLGRLLPEATAHKIGGFCFGLPTDGKMSVVVKDPTQVYIYDHVEIATNHERKAQLLAAEPILIDLALEFIYRVPPALQTEPWQVWLQKKKLQIEDISIKSSDEELDADVIGAAITTADKMIREAISLGASDIHVESFDHSTMVRYRVDGVLLTENEITDRKQGRALVKRLKVMANVDIAQDRLTQGGRISLQVGDRGYDLRVSIVPVPAGESVVMRILNKGAFNIELHQLGFSDEQLELYKDFIDHPHGIILVSGPTGSGKSTTLYASLKFIQRPDRKLLTVEDPIEYQMPGIVQVQVNMAPTDVEKRVTFSKALREFLRQDPDVILVGEIRDEETAHVSIQAALTGHLVLSTIHTNTAVGIVNRLKDMNVKPYLVSSSLVGALAQRLVRKVCGDCKQPVEPTARQQAVLDKKGIKKYTLFRGKGCQACRNSGYKGRIAIYEMLPLTDEIRDFIEREATVQEITRQARSQGMLSLLDDGLKKAAAGIVTMDEVQRVCKMDA